MTSGLVREVANLLAARISGAFLGRVFAPGRWDLGVEVPGGLTLGFCWDPASLAVGLCPWAWPRGNPPDVLKTHLQSARVEGVTALEGEPVLILALKGERARALVWEGLGRSANLLLLDAENRVLWSGRVLKGPFRSGQPGSEWGPPPPKREPRGPEEPSNGERFLFEEGPERIRRGLLQRGRKAGLAALAAREKALARRGQAVNGDRAEGEEWLGFESLGQALLASGDLYRRGALEKRVALYEGENVRSAVVGLDPSLTVLENAQLHFKRARKGQARLKRTVAILEAIEAERSRVAAERSALDLCDDLDRLYPSPKSGRSSERPALQKRLPPGVARVPLPMDFSGFAGKNARGNDTVTFVIGSGGDFWFHAEDYTGCHVVVKNPDRREVLPLQVERAAALYAASHSAAPGGNRVAVTAARCKNLRRVPRSPGRVWVSSPRTLFVDLPPSR